MISLYPGDQIAMLVARWLVAVCLVCGIGLVAAVAWRRNHSARYSVLCSALIITLLLPGIGMAFSATGMFLVSLPWLPAESSSRLSETKEAIGENESRSKSRLRATETIRTQQSTQAPNAAATLTASAEMARLPKPDVPKQSANTPKFSRPIPQDRLREAVAWGILFWGVGVVLLLARLAWSSWRLAQIMRKAGPLTYNQRSRLCAKLGKALRTEKLPRVRLSDQVAGPMACGLFQPTILLPRQLPSQLSNDELCDVLTHEAAHLRRHDPLVLLLQRISGSLYWPIPLIHVLNSQLSQAREELCDNHVLLDRDPIHYGQTLLRVAELVCQRRPVAGTNSMLARTGRLERRIANLLDERRNKMTQLPKGRGLLGFGVLLAAGAIMCGIQIVTASADVPSSEQPAIPGDAFESFPLPEFALSENAKPPVSKKNQAGASDENAPPKNASHRVIFQPMHGMENQSSWTALAPFPMEDKKPYEQLIGRLTLQGEIPVKRKDDKEPIFKIKLMAGRDESLNVRLTGPDNKTFDRVLHRDQPLSWKIKGQTYRIAYPTTEVAADQPAESHYAFVFVTCRPEEKDEKVVDDQQETLPPEESKDDSKGDGGSDLLRNIRSATAPILKDLADKEGYRLDEGQHVRHVPLPYSELRTTYYRVGYPHQAEVIPNPPTHMLFHWADGKLKNWGMSFGGPPESGQSLESILTSVTDLASQEIEIPAGLAEKRLAGDWIIRPGADLEKRLPQLEAILRKELSLPLRLEIKTVEREVFVASGTYKLTPLEGQNAQGKLHLTDKTITTDEVHIFGKAFVPNSGAGGGTGDFEEFLKALGEWINVPIVNEVEQAPSREISYSFHHRSPFTDQMRKEDHDAETVLNNIQKQTNLKFTRQTRPVKILFVTREK